MELRMDEAERGRTVRYQRDRLPSVSAGVVDTGGNFATGVNNTGGKFAAGVNDGGGKLPSVSTTPVANNGNNIRLQTP
jgi:hypothetical protein